MRLIEMTDASLKVETSNFEELFVKSIPFLNYYEFFPLK